MSSLYLHIPFCSSKCPYCDFFSVVAGPAELESYVELLLKHLRLLAGKPEAGPLESIFFGGGTPSLLAPDQLERLLRQAEQSFGLAPEAEISLEANPGTLDRRRLGGYRAAGVNRLSLGIQSLDPQRLQLLGRGHSVEQACSAVEMSRAAGFDNLSLDLMFGLPEQSCAQLEEEVGQLLAFDSDHISLYGLSIEAGTPFQQRYQQGVLEPAGEEECAAQYRLLHRLLTAAGYQHYEISNFARPGRQCRHNLGYWQRRPCLAVGAGGHSFLDRGWGERWQLAPDLAAYRQALARGADPAELLERFDRRGAMAETAYLSLRTSAGLSRQEFHRRFQVMPEEQFARAFERVGGQLQLVDDCWRLTLDGWLIYDHLISHFL